MLPTSKSEFDQQHVVGKNLEEQMHATKTGRVDHDGELADSDVELDEDAEAGLDDADDLDQEAEQKPKKKSMGKVLVIAAAAVVGVIVALFGVVYFMQGQPQKPTSVSKKTAVDPSLMEAKPALNSPAAPISSTEVTPNLSARDTAPVVSPSSSVSNISAPPSDPFSSATTAPVSAVIIAPGTVLTPMPAVVIAPGVAAVPATVIASAPTTTSSVVIIAAPVANVEGPRVDPFGAAVAKDVPKIETVEKSRKPIAEPVVKMEKSRKTAKIKAATDDIEEVSIVQPRVVKKVVVKKVVVKKSSVVRQDMTRSEPHPSQESVQPQSNENFSGYEKLF